MSYDQATKMLLQSASLPPMQFTFDSFLSNEYRYGLDPTRPPCRPFLSGYCPLGNLCPDKHPSTAAYSNLVCKHWLRGLCKKGEQCEFLHEYNIRKMPECNFYIRNGTCEGLATGECLFLHTDPATVKRECENYLAGFCPIGPDCPDKHTIKVACQYWLAGFCPNGRICQEGAHLKWGKDREVEKRREEDERQEAVRRREREGRRRRGMRDGRDGDKERSRSRERFRNRDRDRDRDRDQENGAMDNRGGGPTDQNRRLR